MLLRPGAASYVAALPVLGLCATAAGQQPQCGTLSCRNTVATGNPSVALGFNTTASGLHATAMGDGSVASGKGGTAMGHFTTAGP